jgi:hypothetical protein
MMSTNPRKYTREKPGFVQFRRAVAGQEVVEAIAAVETGYHEPLDAENVPLVPVRILSVKAVDSPN